MAALAVVYAHATSVAGLDLPVRFGAIGVDLSFVISGFVIAYVGSRDSGLFLTRRFIRIVTLYWLATIALFAIAVARPELLRTAEADPWDLLASLFFVPFAREDGSIHPLLSVGWTLNCEIYFYVLFAISRRLSVRWAGLICSVLIVHLMAVSRLAPPDSVAARFYGDPIVLEFILGVGAYHIFRRFQPGRTGYSARAVWVMACMAVPALLSMPAAEMAGVISPGSLARPLSLGIGSFVLVLAMLALEAGSDVRVGGRLGVLLGDASYALYLSHPFAVYAMLRLAISDPHALPDAVRFALVPVLMGMAAVVGVAAYWLLDRPATNEIRRLVEARRQVG